MIIISASSVVLANALPVGYFDYAGCDFMGGWSCDADVYNQPITIHFYADGLAGSGGKLIGATVANFTRELAVGNNCGGNSKHGFSFTTPSSLKDGKKHIIYAYAINIPSGINPLLGTNSRTIQCNPDPACTSGTEKISNYTCPDGSVIGMHCDCINGTFSCQQSPASLCPTGAQTFCKTSVDCVDPGSCHKCMNTAWFSGLTATERKQYLCDGIGNSICACESNKCVSKTICGDGVCNKTYEDVSNCPKDCPDLIKEPVKCVFKGADNTAQWCSSDKGSCKGIGACIAEVSGFKGQKLNWNSSCGNSAYTVIDGNNKTVGFDCSITNCTAEGEGILSYDNTTKCCAGLTKVSASLPDNPTNCSPVPVGSVYSDKCIRCGDGTCGLGENRCNCQQDCGNGSNCNENLSIAQCAAVGGQISCLGCTNPNSSSTSPNSGCAGQCKCLCQNNKCAKEGQYTSGAVSPEYQYGCCSGLVGFNPWPAGWAGGGNLCYDPQKGKPVCLSAGSSNEGWYYDIRVDPSHLELLKLIKCNYTTTTCAKESEYFEDSSKQCCRGLTRTFAPSTCLSNSSSVCSQIVAYTCIKQPTECKSGNNSCCTNNGCVSIVVTCNSGYQYSFGGCNQQCSPIWSCHQIEIKTNAARGCISCNDGTLCGQKNANDVLCACVDAIGNGTNSFCRLQNMGTQETKASYTLEEFIEGIFRSLGMKN